MVTILKVEKKICAFSITAAHNTNVVDPNLIFYSSRQHCDNSYTFTKDLKFLEMKNIY